MMPRFYYTPPLLAQDALVVDEALFRHILALRLREGEALTLFDGQGLEAAARLLRLEKRQAIVQVDAPVSVSRERALPVHLYVGMAAHDKFDWIVQKATELGCLSLTPVLCQHSQVRSQDAKSEKRLQRWQDIVISASEQSGRNQLMQLMPTQKWADCLHPENGDKWIMSPLAAKPMRALPKPQAVHVLIGPEGGFAEAELLAAQAAGWQSVSLGPSILRMETAAISALAACYSLFEESPLHV